MKIGIIGAGQIGGVLAKKLTALGHDVSVANSRGPQSLADVAAETGARAVSVEDAVVGAELVVVTIPQKNVPRLPQGLFRDVGKDVVVVDTGNYYPSFRDGEIAEIEGGETESGWVAKHLGRPVVKVFNNIMAQSLAEGGLPRGTKGRIAMPVAGDEAEAKGVVIALLDALGFDGVDAGSLDESWRQQPGAPVYCTDLDAEGVRDALAKAERARLPEQRERAITEVFTKLPEGASRHDRVAALRSLYAGAAS